MYNDKSFSQILSELRRSSGLSQRKAAADLKISQALLSHYENGAREPGLNFVCRVCSAARPTPTGSIEARISPGCS